jgi:hypothetical protein
MPRVAALASVLIAALVGVIAFGRPAAWVDAQDGGTPTHAAAVAAAQQTEVAAGRALAGALATQVAAAQDVDAALAAAVAAEQAARSELATGVADARAANEQLAATVAALQTQVAGLAAPGPAEPAAASPVAGTGAAVGLNEVAHAGAWDFTVTGVERRESIAAPELPETFNPRGVYLLVTLTVVNAGTEPDYFDHNWFRVTDDRGRTLPYVSAPTVALQIYRPAGFPADDLPGSPTLQPGLPYTAVLVFDIPADATGLTLRLADPEELEQMTTLTERMPSPFAIRLEG